MSSEKLQEFYDVLTKALSPDADVRRPAERYLLESENESGFFASLAKIASTNDANVHWNCRWLAATCGKNAVRRSWRRVRNNRITEDERKLVREILFQMIGETRREVRVQITEWIALIARADFPEKWPEVLVTLAELLMSDLQANVLRHAMEVCEAVVEQLASKRLKKDRLAFENNVPMVLQATLRHFAHHTQILAQNVDHLMRSEVGEQLSLSMTVLKCCISILRKLLVFGVGDNIDISLMSDIFKIFTTNQQMFFAGATQQSGPVEELSIQIGRAHV